ncbi:hypothetical protein TI39_contig4138g00002 [Zymoseptoria brevis]|uniref:Uncharacterized protein n=1 Tax=Zymoseptoria brevis TaxID=1047168 RepID=A0A0F4GFU7_9PEZI|nr:hypothetical protein TI39_contig4138g00002 [Zymoseptoria brevis]
MEKSDNRKECTREILKTSRRRRDVYRPHTFFEDAAVWQKRAAEKIRQFESGFAFTARRNAARAARRAPAPPPAPAPAPAHAPAPPAYNPAPVDDDDDDDDDAGFPAPAAADDDDDNDDDDDDDAGSVISVYSHLATTDHVYL